MRLNENESLPHSWFHAIYSDVVCNISTNKLRIKQKSYLPEGKIPIVDQGQDYIGGYTNDESYIVKCTLPVIVFGDHTRAVKYVNEQFAAGADGVKVLEPLGVIQPKLLQYFTRYLAVILKDKGYARHYQFLAKCKVPIPPTNEQTRIVEKIEELFSELDKGIESLKTAQQQLKVYRQALLKQAFEGKLTEQWRKENPDKVENAEQLLARIKVEREARHQQQLDDWEQAVKEWEEAGKEGKKPAKPKKLKEPSLLKEEDLRSLPTLPEGWAWSLSENISEFITKGTTPKKDYLFAGSGKIPFLKVYNLTHSGTLDFTIDPTFTTEEIHAGFLARSIVYPNDILMNIVGPPLGKVSLVPDDYPEWNINQAIVRFRPFRNILNPQFMCNYLLAANTIRMISRKAKATAGQFNLTLEICREFAVPICSLEEQEKITEILDSKVSMLVQLESEIGTNLKKSEALRQSILKKAFSGQLVPQDPSDEPASELLARIRAEREATEQEAKASKKVTRRRKPKASAA